MKIVVLDGITEEPDEFEWAGLEKLGELTVYDRTSPTDPKEAIEKIGDAEAVFTNKTPLPAEVINACPSIKFICVTATGYNIIDVNAAKARRIPVCNVPAYGTAAVGQFAIALLLEICHRIGHHDKAVHEGRWEKSSHWCFWDFPLIELEGKTMGIIGFGRIGQRTGAIAKAMGMKIIAHDTVITDDGKKIAEYVGLDRLLSESDVISLHCPLFPETREIINKDNIAKMKDGVIIINNSRGQLVAEKDLADALNSGKVYAAGLDVVSAEPVKGDNPLLKAKNCFITPHISWAPKETRERLMDIAVGNLAAFIKGTPENVVNG
jgi:glycerate dehydrogenase